MARLLKIILLIIINAILLVFVMERLFPVNTLPYEVEQAEQYLEENELKTPPKRFSHDGCTFFPDKFLGHNLYLACFEHDIAYWAGGNKEQRLWADLEFKKAIEHTGPLGKTLALLMFHGVRIFGDSFVTKWTDVNWGYGWNK